MKLLQRREPIDEDIMLFTEYLSRALRPAEQHAVEQRLRDDEAFFEKVAPLIMARMVTADRLALHGPLPASDDRQPPVDGDWSRGIRWARRVAAVLALAMIGAGAYVYLFSDRREHAQDVADTLLQRAPSGWAMPGEMTETTPGETLIALTRRGSRVTVRGESRFKYSTSPDGPFAAMMFASLDGEAAFEVSAGEGLVQVKTWAGRVRFDKGSYAIRCAPGCSTMLVTVGAGLATMVSDTTQPGIVLQSGEKGQVPKNGVPGKVTNGGNDWPVPATAAEMELPAIRAGAQQTEKTKAVP